MDQSLLEQLRRKGFHEEWQTIGSHRFEISVRDGFPSEYERQIARLVVEFLERECSGLTRLILIFNDDTHSATSIFIGSTNPDDEESMRSLQSGIEGLYPGQIIRIDFDLYLESPHKDSDHYEHMAYLMECHWRK